MYITPADLAPFATIDPDKADAMIEDAEAMAFAAAPCLADPDPALTLAQLAMVKAVLRTAIIRWNESGSGAIQQETTGPFSLTVDTRQYQRGLLRPSEIAQLQTICGGTGSSSFAIDTFGVGNVHVAWCSVNFGALYCSCGADLTNYAYPLFELD